MPTKKREKRERVFPSTWYRGCGVLSSLFLLLPPLQFMFLPFPLHSIPVPGVLRSPVPAVVSGSLVRDSDDCRDFVVFVFSDDSFSDLSNNNNDCDGP